MLLALAGHGATLEVRDPDGKGTPKGYPYFCPSDASLLGTNYSTGHSAKLINPNDLFDDLGKCDAGTKLVLMDACRNELSVRGNTRHIDLRKVTIPDGVSALFSAGRGQFAYETKKLGSGHGVFFHFVLKGLRGKAKNSDNEITWADLGRYVQK
jgi:uncharacterized caspase-like protein